MAPWIAVLGVFVCWLYDAPWWAWVGVWLVASDVNKWDMKRQAARDRELLAPLEQELERTRQHLAVTQRWGEKLAAELQKLEDEQVEQKRKRNEFYEFPDYPRGEG